MGIYLFLVLWWHSLSLHFGDHLGVSSPDMDRHWGPAKTRYELSEYPNLNTSALGRYMGDIHNIHENRTSVWRDCVSMLADCRGLWSPILWIWLSVRSALGTSSNMYYPRSRRIEIINKDMKLIIYSPGIWVIHRIPTHAAAAFKGFSFLATCCSHSTLWSDDQGITQESGASKELITSKWFSGTSATCKHTGTRHGAVGLPVCFWLRSILC